MQLLQIGALMADKLFDVQITITKTIRVRIPANNPLLVSGDETAADVAEEIAIGGKERWPLLVLSEHEDFDIESVREVAAAPKQIFR
jgi:hypothetical protein